MQLKYLFELINFNNLNHPLTCKDKIDSSEFQHPSIETIQSNFQTLSKTKKITRNKVIKS